MTSLSSNGRATTAIGEEVRPDLSAIGEMEDGEAVRVTDYWGEPVTTPEWRRELTDRLEMPGELGIWPDDEDLGHY